MNPNKYIKTADFIKSFTLPNLLEYQEVMTQKLQDTTDEYEIKRVENLLIIVELEISNRHK